MSTMSTVRTVWITVQCYVAAEMSQNTESLQSNPPPMSNHAMSVNLSELPNLSIVNTSTSRLSQQLSSAVYNIGE